MPVDALKQTVANMNGYAKTGVDPEFGRGSNSYDQMFGDANVKPNPCLGPIDKAPYYAVAINLGDLGTEGRSQGGCAGARAGRQRPSDPESLCRGQQCRQSVRQLLSGRRRHDRPGDDVRLRCCERHRRAGAGPGGIASRSTQSDGLIVRRAPDRPATDPAVRSAVHDVVSAATANCVAPTGAHPTRTALPPHCESPAVATVSTGSTTIASPDPARSEVPPMNDKTLDCSDIDRYLGKPIEGARLKDPIGNLDIKRWAQAMHYPNGLHYNNAFAVGEPLRPHRGAAVVCRRLRRWARLGAGVRRTHSRIALAVRRR